MGDFHSNGRLNDSTHTEGTCWLNMEPLLEHVKHNTEAHSFMHHIEGFVDLRQCRSVGDVLINLDFLKEGHMYGGKS